MYRTNMHYIIMKHLNVAGVLFEECEEDQKDETPFHAAVSCISQSLKTQIINNSNDEVAICFFNTVSW
ncbi:ATP-dependent DNA helicase 2 subunit KU70 [Vitis vinifera]|uniref:ATP-dependent DNA helicase 2 subunit KU70 n=1 Tax=Vitis vinifera TaxID=29760 RepID=A0A438HDP6_VITVI|nr:ATP-dependent DNA helicase 2 subunit KU70 [Vitis vinifera]RVW82570.1 ATP-dependent DNA helicase 2 subunit KU70 [Vitis vinifera]